MQAAFPDKLSFLFERGKWRWKVVYGGRDGAKSWSIARAFLILGTQAQLRILCTREIQTSISQSVRQLLVDQIANLGLQEFYFAFENKVVGRNGTEFRFAGLRNNFVSAVKSFEGIDICWVEEAKDVSRTSWLTLENTIRKAGSEIWVSFNPELSEDETYKKLVLNPPPDARVEKITWRDNPWASEALRVGREKLKQDDYDEYLVVWEGHCRQSLEGAIYAKELRAATTEDRIGRVKYRPGTPVSTYWDLGRSDMTAIWFVQRVAMEWRVIDYYENCAFLADHYFVELQKRPYLYGLHWLPHDAREERLGTQHTIEQQAKEALGKDKVRIVKKIGLANGINAARTIFPNCYFDEEKTAPGLQCLRHYTYKFDPRTKQRSKEPLHNVWSNGADAFRYFAVSVREGAQDDKPKPKPTTNRFTQPAYERGTGWMR